MTYLVSFGDNTNNEIYESLAEIYNWLDEYIINHMQYGDDFETEKKKFIKNQITEVL